MVFGESLMSKVCLTVSAEHSKEMHFLQPCSSCVTSTAKNCGSASGVYRFPDLRIFGVVFPRFSYVLLTIFFVCLFASIWLIGPLSFSTAVFFRISFAFFSAFLIYCFPIPAIPLPGRLASLLAIGGNPFTRISESDFRVLGTPRPHVFSCFFFVFSTPLALIFRASHSEVILP